MAASRPGFRRAVSALAYRDYRRLAASFLFTAIGMQLLQIAVLWQVWELTGSALLLGLTGFVRAGPHMVLSMLGGVLADRVHRLRLIQAGQTANAIAILVLGALTLAGQVEVWHLYAITFINASVSAATQPARAAVIPSLIPREYLVNAIALNATIGQTSQIVGPAAAGVLVATLGLGVTYSASAAVYLVAMLVIFGIRTPQSRPIALVSPWGSFLEGLAFVRRRRVIVSLMAIDLGVNVLGSYRALLPIVADSLGVGPGGFGLLSGAPGVGSLMGTAVILWLGDMRYKGLIALYAALGFCLALVVLALSPWFVVALLATALLGTADAVQMIPRNTVILAVSPDDLRGRVEAFRSMLAGGGPPLGFTLSGAVAAAISVPFALVAGAIACAILVGGIGLRERELRDPELGSARAASRTTEPDAPGKPAPPRSGAS
jgi:MFS family permease